LRLSDLSLYSTESGRVGTVGKRREAATAGQAVSEHAAERCCDIAKFHVRVVKGVNAPLAAYKPVCRHVVLG
jgi:hypothetical protein